MKRSHKVLAWIAGALLALIVLAVIVVATFDWNRLKPFISDKVSNATGRSFAIDGDLTVDWQRDASGSWLASLMPWPQFTARQVTLGNPAWAARPEFARLEAVRFRLSPLALLAHRLKVPWLQLVQPDVDLERDRDARATWQFAQTGDGQPSRWKLELGSIAFDRGRIRLDDALTRSRLAVTVTPLEKAIPYDQLVSQASSAARSQAGKLPERKDDGKRDIGHPEAATPYLFGWTAEGTYKGAPAQGHGKTGGVLALQEDDRPFPVQADVHLGGSHVALVGTLTDPVHLGALDVQLWVSGPSMAQLYSITGITLPDTPPYFTEGHLTATLHGERGSRYRYRDFRGRVGGSDLAGSVDYVTGGKRPRLSGTLTSKLLQFADLAPLIGADSSAAKKQRGDATAQPADKLLPVEPFRTDRWQAMDADVQFTGARIVRGKALPIDALSTHLVMTAGELNLDPLRFGMAGGSVAGTLTLDGSQSPMAGKLKLGARHLRLKELFPAVKSMRTSLGEINGDAQLAARGNSVAALLGNSDGEVKLLMNDGAISKALLETAGLNVGNIVLAKLFGDRTVQINCAATDLSATDGVFSTRLFVFDTDDAVINVEGTVNMATEQLDLDIKPHTKGFRIFSLRSPLYVRGTLKHPDVGVHAGPLIARSAGAVALGVVAAPAAALLALVAPSHDNDGDNACRAVLQQLRSSGKIPGAARPATPARKSR
jgi:AsmA family protein